MKAPQWTSLGSVVSAAAASACCWLPLVMVATGFSVVGLSTFFQAYRPLFLTVAAVLLGAGFYLNYRPQSRHCAADASCSAADRRLRRWNLTMLWISTALVIALAMFPHYVSSLMPTNAATSGPELARRELTLDIDGMTCEGCEIAVEGVLSELPEVETVDADYSTASAKLTLGPGGPPSREALERALGRAGYSLGEIRPPKP